MAKTKRFFLSDIHLSSGKTEYWYKKKSHEDFLVEALEMIAADPAAKDLVLLGDIFDTWMSPIDEVPPTTAQIILEGDHEKVWAALSKCAAAVENVFYLNGNHDMETNQADLTLLQTHAKMDKPIRWIPKYQAGLLYAEHGSRFAMFNAPDRMHDPKDALPIGYFITRLLAGNESYVSPAALAKYVDDLLEAAFTTQTIAASVIEALMESSGKKSSDVVKMPEPRTAITLGEVKDKYAHLFTRWVEKFGHWYAVNAVRGEMNSLGWFADRLCKREGYKVVVFGHTHDAMQDGDGLIGTKRIYANSGYFCSKQPTFVAVDKKARAFEVIILRGDPETKSFKELKKAKVGW